MIEEVNSMKILIGLVFISFAFAESNQTQFGRRMTEEEAYERDLEIRKRANERTRQLEMMREQALSELKRAQDKEREKNEYKK